MCSYYNVLQYNNDKVLLITMIRQVMNIINYYFIYYLLSLLT